MKSTPTKKLTPKKPSDKKTFKPGKGKSWADKLNADKKPEVSKLDKSFADMPAGCTMLIATPKIINDYVKQIPKGKSISVLTMRNDLAHEYQAEYTCPLTTGIFLRIVAEAANEELKNGKPIAKITPFWRVVDEKSTLAKKLEYGPEFIKAQRKKEKIQS